MPTHTLLMLFCCGECKVILERPWQVSNADSSIFKEQTNTSTRTLALSLLLSPIEYTISTTRELSSRRHEANNLIFPDYSDQYSDASKGIPQPLLGNECTR